MAGKCVYCGIETKNRVKFTNANGIVFEYYSCMKGKCATQSIDKMFGSLKEKGLPKQEDVSGDLDFDVDEVKALFG